MPPIARPSPARRIGYANRYLLAMLFLGCCVLAAPAQETAAPNQRRLALLVGCTKYPQATAVKPLEGPANDVALMARLLHEKFAFDDRDITRLVGWPDDERARPTYANIVAAFESLIAKAARDTQIFIMLNGHGTQLPVDAGGIELGGAADKEVDGFDEVFLPADIGGWSGSGLKNAIRDDQIAQWLAELRRKGAAVWIVFDCCHSGTMNRAGVPRPDEGERERGVSPRDLGVPAEVLRGAAEKAAAPAVGRGVRAHEPTPIGAATVEKGQGSVVAFFAAQSFEKAPELPRPSGAARSPENFFGMLSYTLAKVLDQQQGRLSYRELSQLVLARYQADRGTRPPAPFCDGDVEKEVLGVRTWPKQADMFLRRENDQLTVNAGELRGLSIGSVLAVQPLGGANPEEAMPVGHVRVTSVTPISSRVEPCAFGEASAVLPDKLPAPGRCRLASREFGDMRLKLAIVTDAQSSADPDAAKTLGDAVSQFSADVQRLVSLTKPEDADWHLRIVRPAEAKQWWSLKLAGAEVFLLPAGTVSIATADDPTAKAAAATLAHYPAVDAKALAAALDRDLLKVFKYHNLQRVVGTMERDPNGTLDRSLKLEVYPLKNETPEGKPLTSGSALQPGNRVELRLTNQGIDNLWVTVLCMDSNLRVSVLVSTSMKRDESLQPLRGTITEDGRGRESFVVFALSHRAYREQPNFAFLEQEALGVAETRRRSGSQAPATPFGRFIADTTFGSPGKRTYRSAPGDLTNPEIAAFSWITLPAAPDSAASKP